MAKPDRNSPTRTASPGTRAARSPNRFGRPTCLPDDLDAQLKASAYLLLARQFEDAKTRVQRVLDRDPRNTQGLLILGNALAGLRDLDGAIAQVEQAIAIDPSNAGSYASLAGLKLADGEREAGSSRV